MTSGATTAAASGGWPRRGSAAADVFVPSMYVALFLAGAVLNALAYQSLVAFGFGFLMLTAAAAPAALLGRSLAELVACVRVFAVCWFMAGIAAAFAAWGSDPLQLDSDASTFFELASGAARGLGLAEITEISEGAGAIVIWRAFYEAAAALGFERARYVGIGLNCALVAWFGALAMRACRTMYGADTDRERRLVWLLTGCGLLWLFAAVHLRDAAVLLAVSIAVYLWLRFLSLGGGTRATVVALAMPLLAAVLGTLRREFALVPLVTTVAGLLSIVMAPSGGPVRRWRWPALGMLGAGAALAAGLVGEALFALGAGSDTYRELARAEASSSSLGAALVVNQPPAIRAVVGTAYLLMFPIPVWSGFVSGSVIQLFKSCSALFFYATVPMVAVAVGTLWREPSERRADRIFALMIGGGFVVAIALSSLEVRHLGSFLLPLLLLAILPDPRSVAQQSRLWRALLVTLTAMLLIHVAWVVLKVLVG